jgi:ankyrin repeat protein
MSDKVTRRAITLTLLVLLVVVAAASPYAEGHETDQYTLPPRRQFAEVGPYLTRLVYDAVAKGAQQQNNRIHSAVNAKARPAEVEKLQSPEDIAAAVNTEFPVALFFIESLDRTMTSSAMATRYPGCVVGYKPFVGVRKNIDIGLNPFRAWNCATVRAYGVYMGDDKLGHFSDMGKHYFDTYRDALRRGMGEEKAVREAIRMGTDGPIYSEKGLLGLMTAGAYSNGDLVSNYMGFCFYKNLTQPVVLKGERRPPLLVRDGAYWKLAPHVRPDSDFFSWYISDHLNEALNPSLYRFDFRKGIRRAITEYRKDLLPRYADANGNPRSPDWFAAKTAQLKTYYGFDYGHDGDKELNRMSDCCFAKAPDMKKPSVANGDGLLPMHYAAMRGDVLALQKLQEGGADLNARVNVSDSVAAVRGDTPLHLAAREGKVPAVAFLLIRGADVRARNERGVTPLHMACDQPQVALLLIEAGAEVDAADETGRTPLHWAANDPAGVATQVLVNHGGKSWSRDRDGRTPLHLAAAAGHDDAIDVLLRANREVDSIDRFGATAIHLAAAGGHVKVTEQLLTAGAAPNSKDEFGCTPLLAALRAGQQAAAGTLLSHGADPDAADAYGTTPMTLAQRENMPSLVTLLRQASEAQVPTASEQAAGGH